MKRSTLGYISLALFAVEVSVAVSSLNDIYKFLNGVLQAKYYALFAISYVGFSLFSLWYFTFSVPKLEYKRSVKEHFQGIYGEKKFSIIYTLHFLLFAVASFYTDAWPYFIMSVGLWIFWTWVRSKQNSYADEYELIRKKEEAKHKPTVVLDSTNQ